MEQWKVIEGFEKYMVSTTGKVKGINGEMKGSDNGNGYLRVLLYKEGKANKKYIHRLVAEAFIPNPNNLPEVNHIDCNPSNNNIENLEWCTHLGNMQWMVSQGRNARTEKWLNNLHKAQEKTYVAVVGTNILTGEKIYFSKLNDVRKAGFQPSCVCYCCKGKRGIKQHKDYEWNYESQVI